MKSFFLGYTASAPTAGSTMYQPMVTQGSASAWASSLPAADYQQPIPHALTLDRLRVKVATAPGSGKNYVFTVLKNGSATGITCTISGTNTTAQDLTHTASFAAGDTITLQAALDTGGTLPSKVYWSTRQDASGLTAILGGAGTTSLGGFSPMGYNTNTKANGDMGVIVPCGGTVENLYINAAASGPVVTAQKNSSAQTLTVTLSSATGNDTTHNFSVAAGDRLGIKTATSGQKQSWGMSFAPTTDGQSFYGHVSDGNTNTGATAYIQPQTTSGSPGTTEASVQIMVQACTLVAIYSQTAVSPGVSPKAYAFTVRQNTADTAATCTVNDASSTPNDGSGRAANLTGQSITLNDDDLVDFKEVPTSTPTGTHAYSSMLVSVAGAAPAANSGFLSFM